MSVARDLYTLYSVNELFGRGMGIMDRTQVRLLIGAVCAIGILVATGAVAATATNSPEDVTIDACKKKKSAVAFAHGKHAKDRGIACDQCHHTQKGLAAGANTEVKKCSGCHLAPEKPDTPVCTSASPKKNNYHIQCVGCHKEEAKKDAAKGKLTKCGACHP